MFTLKQNKSVICPKCKTAGQKSVVYEGCTTSTLIDCPAFYDEEGKRHVHDTNTHAVSYQCSNGHTFSNRYKPGSCWCGWKAE